MPESLEFTCTVNVEERDDGLLMATSRHIPMYVVARTEDELHERLQHVMASFIQYLNRRNATPEDVLEFLERQQIPFERTQENAIRPAGVAPRAELVFAT